jgi:hypothetical protein
MSRPLILLTGALAGTLALACETGPDPLEPEAPGTAAAAVSHSARLALGAEVNKDLAALRRLTAAFHDFDKATVAGWSAQITACLEDPSLGAQGFHYGNPAFIDGDASVLEPELLLYEPQSNGRLRLVGIEYIVPFTIVPSTADPPTLFGQEFHQNFVFGVWALHVWVWRHNPSGLFADWNPKVSCAAAT